MNIEVSNHEDMQLWGAKLGGLLRGGEVIELIGDVGAGKTTLTKGLALGMGIDETVQSPTFTINRVYDAADGRRLVHYDFYRLGDAGIMADELHETISDQKTVTVIEWAGIVDGVLPADRVSITITSPSESTRRMAVSAGGAISQALVGRLA